MYSLDATRPSEAGDKGEEAGKDNAVTLTMAQLSSAIDDKRLTELILSKYDELFENGIFIEYFYYAPTIYLSDEPFDMFSKTGLKNFFEHFGFSTESETLSDEDEVNNPFGTMRVFSDLFSFTMDWEVTMHDSLIAAFVDAKTARY